MSRAADSAEHYLRAVLAAYRNSPDTLGHVRPADRRFAATLLLRGVPLQIVEEAMVLAVARRQTGGQSHEPIRSLHYFRPVIEELIRHPLPAEYADYLRQRLFTAADAQEERPDAGPKKNGC